MDGDPLVHLDLVHGALLPLGFHYPVEDVDVGVGHGGIVDWARDIIRLASGWVVLLLKSCGLGKEHVHGCFGWVKS